MMVQACIVSLFLCAAAPSGQIAFVSGASPDTYCVCVLDLQSGAVARVGPGTRDGAPVWSPDGQWLAFSTQQPDGLGICLARPDGSETRRVAHQYKWNRNPRWSGDGALLIYEADDGEGPAQHRLMVYDFAAGTEASWGGGKIGLLRPVWMPNMMILMALHPDQQLDWGGAQTDLSGLDWLQSSRAAIAIGLAGTPAKPCTELVLVTSDKAVSLPQQVMPSRGNYVEWAVEPSPDGFSIAFESNDGGDREIFVISRKYIADVSSSREPDWNPVWSPDGHWIAFESFRGGRRGIYCVFPETLRVSPVSANSDWDVWSPSWSPDSKRIAHVSTQTGMPQIFVSDRSGGTSTQVTDLPVASYAPAWRPKAKK